MKKPFKSNLLNYLFSTSVPPREQARRKRYLESKMKKNYKNYKVDCLFLKKKPMTFSEFKKIYSKKEYIEEDIF